MPNKRAKGILLASLDRDESKYCLMKSSATGEYHVALIAIYGEPQPLCEPAIMTFKAAADVVRWANGSLRHNVHGFGNERALVQLAADRDDDIKEALINNLK